MWKSATYARRSAIVPTRAAAAISAIVVICLVATGTAQRADAASSVLSDEELSPIGSPWEQLPQEPWDLGRGCSVAARQVQVIGRWGTAVEAGGFGTPFPGDDERRPSVVPFLTAEPDDLAGTGWFRSGGISTAIGLSTCPGVSAAEGHTAKVLQWGSTAGVLVERYVDEDPLLSEAKLLLPAGRSTFSPQVAIADDGTAVVAYDEGGGIQIVRPHDGGFGRISLPFPSSDHLSAPHRVAIADGVIVVASWGTDAFWLVNVTDLHNDPVPARRIDVDPGWHGFGYSVDVGSGFVVVGAPANIAGGGGIGAVYVFDLADIDSPPTVLLQTDGNGDDAFGASVAIDNGRIAIGAPKDDDGGYNAGSLYLFEYDGQRWNESKVGTGSGDETRFGTDVDIAGNTVIVGAPGQSWQGGREGAVWSRRLPDRGAFVDDDSSVFRSDIDWMAGEGITKGCNPPLNDKYCPDAAVTRSQMAAFLVRALDLTDRLDDPFIDDDDSVFEADIEKLAAVGITKGCNPPANDRFCPDAKVTREQMAAFLVRALGYTDDGGGDLFIDDDDSIFEADIDRLGTAGVTRGCNPPTNDRYCPKGNVTRGQMAAFLHRALG